MKTYTAQEADQLSRYRRKEIEDLKRKEKNEEMAAICRLMDALDRA